VKSFAAAVAGIGNRIWLVIKVEYGVAKNKVKKCIRPSLGGNGIRCKRLAAAESAEAGENTPQHVAMLSCFPINLLPSLAQILHMLFMIVMKLLVLPDDSRFPALLMKGYDFSGISSSSTR
jgi:hypothetical protein